MSDETAETKRATALLGGRPAPADRRLGDRGIGAPYQRLSGQGPFARRFSPERVRQGQEEARRALERTVALERIAALRVRTPLPILYRAAVFDGDWSEVLEVLASMLPIVGDALDVYYLTEGRDLHGRQLELSDRAFSAVGLALLVIPIAGRLARDTALVARIASRTGRSVERVRGLLRSLDSLAGKEQALQEAFAIARRGERLEGRHERALREFVDAFRRDERRLLTGRNVTTPAPARPTTPVPARPAHPSPRRARPPRPRPTGALRGLRRLHPQVRTWLTETVLRNDAARIAQAARSLSRAGDDVIAAINTFWHTSGFSSVVTSYLAGRNMQQGARFVMRYALKNFARRVNRAAIVFEMPTLQGLRRLDLWVDGIKYEFKSVRELHRSLVRGRGNHFGQLMLDLIGQIGHDFSRLRNLRWVFDGKRIGLTRAEIVGQLQAWILESNLLRGYPRAAMDEILRAIDRMVELG